MSIIYCDKHDLKWDSDFKSECPACENEEKTHREGAIEHGASVTEARTYRECPLCGTELGGKIPHIHTFP